MVDGDDLRCFQIDDIDINENDKMSEKSVRLLLGGDLMALDGADRISLNGDQQPAQATLDHQFLFWFVNEFDKRYDHSQKIQDGQKFDSICISVNYRDNGIDKFIEHVKPDARFEFEESQPQYNFQIEICDACVVFKTVKQCNGTIVFQFSCLFTQAYSKVFAIEHFSQLTSYIEKEATGRGNIYGGSPKLIAEFGDMSDIEDPSVRRTLFINQCVSKIQHPDDISFFFVKNLQTTHFQKQESVQSGEVIDMESIQELFGSQTDSNPFGSTAFQTQLSQKKNKKFLKPRDVKQFGSFKGSDHVWQTMKIIFQQQKWEIYTDIMYKTDQQHIPAGFEAKDHRDVRLSKLFPIDYQQTGFIDDYRVVCPDDIKYKDSDEFCRMQLQLQKMEHAEFRYSKSHEVQQWCRNKSVNILARCLQIQAVHKAREQPELAAYINNDNYQHFLQKTQTEYQNELLQHNQIDQNNKIHPHPCIFLKNSVYRGFTMLLEEPFMLGPLYTLSCLNACRFISYQLMCVDSVRQCDSGCIVLCGESRSGKSVILDAVSKFFGGYDWKKTNSNFQNEEIQFKGVVVCEEMDICQLANEKSGCNMWKKRLDQTISCDIDIKCKPSIQCLQFVPFFMTTNKKPIQIKKQVDSAFNKRLTTCYFPFQLTQLISKLDDKTQMGVQTWQEQKDQLVDEQQKQMMCNLIILSTLLFPPIKQNKRVYFIDDQICEHLIQILLKNWHSPLLFLYFRCNQGMQMRQALEDFQQLTRFQRMYEPNEPQISMMHWAEFNKYISVKSQSCAHFEQSLIKLAHLVSPLDVSWKHVYENLAENKTPNQQLKVIEEISHAIGKGAAEGKFRWYRNHDEVRKLVKDHVPASNLKNHILRIWDKTMLNLNIQSCQ